LKILDLYIAKSVLSYTVLVLAVLLGLLTFVAFIDEFDRIGSGSYNLWEASKYIFFTTPRRLYEIFPMTALIGTLLALSAMSADSELVVMRASGVSIAQIVLSVMKIGAVLAVFSFVIGEFVTPVSETKAQRDKALALQQNINQETTLGLWMRDKNIYVNVAEVLPDLTLLGIKIFEFDAGNRLKLNAIAHAQAGVYSPEEKKWELKNLRQTVFTDNSVKTDKAKDVYWKTVLSPEILNVFLIKPDQLSVWYLHRYIRHLRANSQNTNIYELAFWKKILGPFSTLVMVLLAVPFVFRQQLRAAGMGQNLFLGVMLGLAFFLASQGFGNLALVYNISPVLGAVLPTLVFFLFAMFMLRRVY